MTAPPKWAQELMIKTLIWWESQGDEAPVFGLDWRRGSHRLSSGRSFGEGHKQRRVVVTGGKSRLDARLVLLHEIAHQLTNCKHGDRFWDVAWQLYRWAKLPIRYCQQREYSYKVGAQVAYRRNKGG